MPNPHWHSLPADIRPTALIETARLRAAGKGCFVRGGKFCRCQFCGREATYHASNGHLICEACGERALKEKSNGQTKG